MWVALLPITGSWTGQKGESWLSRNNHCSLLPDWMLCEELPQGPGSKLPFLSRMYAQTMSENNPFLPESASVRMLDTATERLTKTGNDCPVNLS